MAQTNDNDLDAEIQTKIFEKLASNDTLGFEQLIVSLKTGVDFLDSSGMTPLQHACCKGNKQAVQILLDMGADVNYNKQGNSYTTLHFAALSGKSDICRMLLDCGVNPYVLNSVNRTATQMAAFVGNYECVETINNYVPMKVLEGYTKPQGQQNEPYVPPTLLKAFHTFVIEVSLHPVRIALNLQSLGLIKYLSGLREALGDMCEKEMKKPNGVNELLAFKFHYLRWIIAELMRCETQCKAQRKEKAGSEPAAAATPAADAPKNDFLELFIKRVLKENKQGQLDYVEYTVRECVREYPFRECTVFRQIVQQLASKDALPALCVLRAAINGQRPFGDEVSFCSTCGHERPDKKCSKCKAVQYCDRECQRLHWFMHKKTCARPTSASAAAPSNARGPIDTEELRHELAKMAAN